MVEVGVDRPRADDLGLRLRLGSGVFAVRDGATHAGDEKERDRDVREVLVDDRPVADGEPPVDQRAEAPGGAETQAVEPATATVTPTQDAELDAAENWYGGDDPEDVIVDRTGGVEIGDVADEPYEGASFDVDAVDAPDAVDQFDTITVTVDVENDGDLTGVRDVTLAFDGDVVDTEEVELATGASDTVALTYDTEAFDVGDATLTVDTGDDSDTADVTVETVDPASFSVDITAPEDGTEVTDGDTVEVIADIENTGGATDTQDVALSVNGTVVATADDLTLAGGASETVTLPFDADEVGDRLVTMASDDDSDAITASVVEAADPPTNVSGPTELDPAFFEVSELDVVDVTVERGEPISVSATVENTGERPAQRTVEFRVDDTVLAEETVLLGSDGGTDTVTFDDIDTSELDAGEYTHGVFTDNDSRTGTLTVEAVDEDEAVFEVSDLDPVDATVDQGDLIDVSATVTNTGGADGTQTVELRVDGNAVAIETVDLDAGADQAVEFTDVDTAGLDDEVEHGVFTDDDSQTGTLTVVDDEEPPEDDAPEDETPEEPEEPADFPIPGFGAVVALAALLAAALIATRVRE